MADLSDATKQERRLRAGELLKMADKLFKASDLEGALRSVSQAIEIDPKNPYAIAYQERVRHAIETRDHKQAESARQPQDNVQVAPPPQKAATPATVQPPAGTAGKGPDQKLITKLEARIGELEEQIRLQGITEAKLRSEVEEHRRLEGEDLRRAGTEMKRAIEDANRKLAEEQKRREQEERLRQESEARWKKELEVQRAASLEEQKKFEALLRQRAEEEIRKHVSAEQARLKQETEDRIKRELEAQRAAATDERKKMEALFRQRAEEEIRRHVAEESKRVQQEFQKQLDAERKKIEAEALKQIEVERRKVEEAARKDVAAAQQQIKAQEEKLRDVEREARKMVGEERTKLAAEIRRKVEEELSSKFEEERERLEQETRRSIAEEDARQYEEAVRRAIEEGRRLAQSRKVRSYLDAARVFLVQGQYDEATNEVAKVFQVTPDHQEALELQKAIEAERGRRSPQSRGEEESFEEHSRKVGEIQARLEEQQKKEREEEEERSLREKKVAQSMRRAKDFVSDKAYDEAMTELEMVYQLDPGNQEAQDCEIEILNTLKKKREASQVPARRAREVDAWRRGMEEQEKLAAESKEQLEQETHVTYRSMLKQAWLHGQPGAEERAMLDVVRRSLNISDGVHATLEREVQIQAYTEALRSAWKAGLITDGEPKAHDNLRQVYRISTDDQLAIEAKIKREMKHEE